MLLLIYDEMGVIFDFFFVKVVMDLYDKFVEVKDFKFINYIFLCEEVL